MEVGVLARNIDSNIWKYTLECPTEEDESKGFCGEFTINASIIFIPQTFDLPESYDTSFNWDSIFYDKESSNIEAMKAWVGSHQNELESLIGEEYKIVQ